MDISGTVAPPRAEIVEVRGRVAEVLRGTATVVLEGRVLPQPGDHATFVRSLGTPDQKLRLVGQGKVTEVFGGDVFVQLKLGAELVPGDQMRVSVVQPLNPGAAAPR